MNSAKSNIEIKCSGCGQLLIIDSQFIKSEMHEVKVLGSMTEYITVKKIETTCNCGNNINTEFQETEYN